MQHGEWLPMLREIGISHTVAKELMSIGGNAAISNGRSSDHLPASTRALYELSRLAPEVIESGIEHGDSQGTLARLARRYSPYAPEFSAMAQERTRSRPEGGPRRRAGEARGGAGGGPRRYGRCSTPRA